MANCSNGRGERFKALQSRVQKDTQQANETLYGMLMTRHGNYS